MKKMFFRYGDTLNVECVCTLNDETNLDENFIVKEIGGVDTSPKIKMFYWLKKYLPYTLNELIFFAHNNGLVITIYNQAGDLLATYS